MDFGERLKDLRVQKDMTQEDVASKLFVTKQAVSRWENGNCLPDVASLGKLAEIFDVNIDYLLTGNENIKVVEKETVVEKEKIVEVEKEKIVKVEKPLSDEIKSRILEYYNRVLIFTISDFIVALMAFIAGICFAVIDDDTLNRVLLSFGFCGVFIVLGIIGINISNKEKKKIEAETGRKIKLFKFKDK